MTFVEMDAYVNPNKTTHLLKNPVWVAFFISIIYWGYLFFNSSMIIRFDSLGYEILGSMLYKEGWKQYFVTGPSREPLYPWGISISMRLADQWGISYQVIQKFIQIIFLFITQLLTFQILKKLRIPMAITALTLLYLGFSPAIINSALTLYSEIFTYPFILGIILMGARVWKLTQKEYNHRLLLSSLGLGLLFVGIMFVKAVFEYILFIFLIPFFYLLLKAAMKGNKKIIKNTSMVLLMVIVTFHGFVVSYKLLNKKYNGVYTFTDRGAWALYGNTARRMQPMNTKRIISGMAFVAGEGVCRRFFDPVECTFWSYSTSDNFGFSKWQEFERSKMPKDKFDPTFLELSKNLILQNPLQYLGITFMASFGLFFWESTKIGFVDYPGWLNKLYDCRMFKDGLRLFIFLITLVSFVYLLWFVWKNKSKLIVSKKTNLSSTSLTDDQDIPIIFFILILLCGYIALHSLFLILTRYALPIASLYLIAIAFFLKQMMIKIQTHK